MYLLLVVAAILYSLQFIFNQKYEISRGNGQDATLLFQINVAVAGMILMYVLNKFQIQFTVFSSLIALWYAVDIMLYITFSMKAFGVTNLSVYSLFTMLGGMMLPFIFGIVFYQEEVNAPKIIGCIMIIFSLGMTLSKGRGERKAAFYYLAVFVFNGMQGVIFKIHNTLPEKCCDSNSFIFMVYAFMLLLSLGWYLMRNKRLNFLHPRESFLTTGYAVCNGLGELFCLIALTVLPASVQFPMITGGVIFFSAIISAVTEKQMSAKSVISVVTALIATIIIAL